jgi:hypothetical protein
VIALLPLRHSTFVEWFPLRFKEPYLNGALRQDLEAESRKNRVHILTRYHTLKTGKYRV